MPSVSVLIPAFRATYLREALASVLSQTFGDYELLVSDDSSGSEVQGVLDEFGDKRIRRLQGPRQGLVANTAFMVEQAGCDLLKFVYDDDFLLPFGLARLVEMLEAAPQASLAFTFRHWVSADGRILHSPVTIDGKKPTLLSGRVAVDFLISRLDNFIGEPTNVLLRRSSIETADRLRLYAGAPVRHLVDVALYLSVLQRGPCMGIPEFHAAFRRHDEQTTSYNNPAFSLGIIEWEMFLRGEFSGGRCSGESALQGVGKLTEIYGRIAADYSEADLFSQGLPALADRIRAGDRNLLDDGFHGAVRRAVERIAARRDLRQPGTPPLR